MIEAECTWGMGPDVMVRFKDQHFILYEKPKHNKPPRGDFKHGFVEQGSFDLTKEEALEFGDKLISAAKYAEELESQIPGD